MSTSELVEHLREELEREASCRQRQEELNSKLHQEYDYLLKRLAEAELHIDQMRLGMGEGRGTHRLSGGADQLRGRLDSSLRTCHNPDSTMHLHSKNPYQQNGIRTHNKYVYPQGNTGVNTEQDAATNDENSPELSTPQVSSHVSLSSLEHSGETNGLESQASLINSTCTDISEMSASSIANRASAESVQMAHLFRIHNLQEEISALKDKINSGGVSVGEVMDSLEKIQEDHRQLAQDIASSSAQLDALSQRYRGEAAAQIARSQEAIGSELVSLAEQLRELEELLNVRASELFCSPPPTLPTSPTRRESIMLPSVSTTESAMAVGGRQEGKPPSSPDDHLSDDSLNSPFVPDKYFTESALHMHTHPNTPPLHVSTEDHPHAGSHTHSNAHTGSYTHSNAHIGSHTHSNIRTGSHTHLIVHTGSHTHSRSPTPNPLGSHISKDGPHSLSSSHPLDLSEREELSQRSSEEGEVHSASSNWSSSLLSDQLKSPPIRTDHLQRQHSSSQTTPNGGGVSPQRARGHLRDVSTEVDRNFPARQPQGSSMASANLTPDSVAPPPPTHGNSRNLQSLAQPHLPKSTATPSPTPPSILHGGSRNRHTHSPPHLHHSHTSYLNPTHIPKLGHTHFLPPSPPPDLTRTLSSLSSPTFPASSRQSPMGQPRPPSNPTPQPCPPSNPTPQPRPPSDLTTLSEQSFASSKRGRSEQHQGSRDRHPSLTTAALDALRGELRELREQILTSIQHRTPPHQPTHQPVSDTPPSFHHTSNASPLTRTGSSDQGVCNTVTTASQTVHQMKADSTASQAARGAFSDGCIEHKPDVVFSLPGRVRLSTHSRATKTSPFLNDRSTQTWEQRPRSSTPDTHTNQLLHSDLLSRSSRFLSPAHMTSGTCTHQSKNSAPLHVSILEPKHGNLTPHPLSTSEAESSSSISIPSGVDPNQWVCLKCKSRTTKFSPGTHKHKHKYKHKHRKRGDKGTQVSMTYHPSPPHVGGRTTSSSADPSAHTIRGYRFSQRTSRGVSRSSSESSGSESEVRVHSEDRSSYKRPSQTQTSAATVQSHTPRDKLSESRQRYSTRPVATSTPAHSNRHSYWRDRDQPKSSATEPHIRYRHRDASTVGAESYRRPQYTYRTGATSHPEITLGSTLPPPSERSRSHSPLGHYHARPTRTQRTEERDSSLRLYTPHSRGDTRFSRVSPIPGEEMSLSEPGVSPVRRRRGIEPEPCSVEGFYVVDGSGVYSSGTRVQVVDVPVPDLSEVCRMARELRRYSMRLQGTLDSELSRRSSRREFN